MSRTGSAFAPALDLDELAGTRVGAGDCDRGEQTSDENPHGHAAPSPECLAVYTLWR